MMKKALLSALVIMICIVLFSGCDRASSQNDGSQPTGEKYQAEIEKYKVEILNADDFDIESELKDFYTAGENVTIQLATITEHYYVLSVNGAEQTPDNSRSDNTYTYYTFVMPNENVTVKIEDRWVDIPEAP